MNVAILPIRVSYLLGNSFWPSSINVAFALVKFSLGRYVSLASSGQFLFPYCPAPAPDICPDPARALHPHFQDIGSLFRRPRLQFSRPSRLLVFLATLCRCWYIFMIYALAGSVMSPINILVLSSGPTFSGLSTFSRFLFFCASFSVFF